MSADDIQYKSVPLYGGAIVCDLPENFADVRYAPRPARPSPDKSTPLTHVSSFSYPQQTAPGA
jgi:hypothetical protein